MNYTTVVGPEMNGFELSVTFRKPLKSGNVTVYHRQGERLIWKATFSVTGLWRYELWLSLAFDTAIRYHDLMQKQETGR